jgi:phosphoribosylglycinamide formyltransferase-1
MNICVFASTNGTDLQAVIDEMKAQQMPGIDLKFVLVNKEDCGAADKARKAGIPVIFLNPKDPAGKLISREIYDQHIDTVCKQYEIDLIVLVGWMRILSPWFVKQYPKRIINIHPSLLPKYPGMDLDVHKAVIDAGEKESGMTIHYVDEIVDHGEIILQKKIPVALNETPETLKTKVQALEKHWYPEVIRRAARQVSGVRKIGG